MYWYYFHIYCCPVCGKINITKERRYTNKPKDRERRKTYIEHYDGCGGY